MKRSLYALLKDEAGWSTEVEHSLILALLASVMWLTLSLQIVSRSTTLVAMTVPAKQIARDWAYGSTFKEHHYQIKELATMWGIGRETVRLLVKDEPGVLRIRQGRKKAHTTYSVPESVALRIYIRLQSAS